MYIPFNRPFAVGKEFDYIQQAIANLHLSGDGPFTKKCQAWLEEQVGCNKAFLTHSCTAALEMAAILTNLKAGDEIIMPSYTFVSTANAFVLRGSIPVFVDIRPDTLNLDETKIEAAITPRTKAIVPVHYAGVGCNMDAIMAIAAQHNLLVIEDAAQGVMATYKDRWLGSLGHLAAISFHETKNVISGEGGALLINDPRWAERAEIIWEKGTNRSRFFRGEVDKYTWVDVGSSYLPSEINAAFLWAQLEEAQSITRQRLKIWEIYYAAFAKLETLGKARRPLIPAVCRHNAHMYYLLLPDLERRIALIESLKDSGVNSVFHYVPLHTSPAGKKFGRVHGDLLQTQRVSDCLVRLPLWVEMAEEQVTQVVEQVYYALNL
ncbi:MAG: dTDP-4-amino-4,6-dideoxygalactose transaminase [Deltaproteobacteria bacterium]|nr:dTDP-4-amino-4,6-dideoxygalactose transaminase [Deltaproteobacteria bacterium]